jgi:uncharacterized repeat protein (TIGR01451 family)
MLRSQPIKNLQFLLTVAIATCCVTVPAAWAQQDASRDETSRENVALQVPVPSESLRLTVDQPGKVRVDQPFDMRVQVSNVSDNIVFRNVKIGHKAGDQLSIESSRFEGSQESQGRGEPSPQTAQSTPERTSEQQRTSTRENDSQSSKQQPGSDQQSKSQQEQGQQGQTQQKESGQKQKDQQKDQQKKQQQKKKQQEQQKQQQKKQSGQQSQQASGGQGKKGQQGGGARNFDKTWTIDKLRPGETRTIHITASSQQEGRQDNCLALVSYTPSICVPTEFVKPELEIAKQGPDQANICEMIQYEYFVKNTGSGAIEQFTIKDELAEGLQTADGKQQLEFQVDGGLDPGEVRKFVVDLRPMHSGEFSSRAIATSPTGEKTRSSEVMTRVVEPQLAMKVEGPDAVYLDRPATYTVRMTNHGDGVSEETRLSLKYPQILSLASASDPRQTDRAVQQPSGSTGSQNQQGQNQQSKSKQGEDQEDQNQQGQNPQNQNQQGQNQQSQNQQSQNQQGQNQEGQNQQGQNQQQSGRQQQMETLDWDIGQLAPGESRLVRVTFNTDESGNATLQGRAVAICAEGDDRQTLSTAQDQAQTEIISLPALMLIVVDETDPVPTKDEVVYRVVVRNEGTAPDSNVRVSVRLPQELEFVEVSGQTKAQSKGNNIEFEAIKSLEPGAEATWRVRTRTTSEGDIAVTATLESEFLSRTVRAEEPTTIFSASAGSQSGQSQQQSQDDQN